MRIYLVRHGQTLFNLSNRIQGWCDSPLTQLGIQQAQAVGNALQAIDFSKAYCSTSERCVDTMQLIIDGRAITWEMRKQLKEINFGTLEGEYESEKLASDGSSHDIGFVEFGGETLTMTQTRMANELYQIAQENDGNVLVVSHGGAIMCALLALFDYPVQMFRKEGNHIENGSVSILEFDKQKKQFELVRLADVSFRDQGMRGA